ncbi:hypothetical protein ACWD6P_09160 [Streptomyces sp. NPDC002446]
MFDFGIGGYEPVWLHGRSGEDPVQASVDVSFVFEASRATVFNALDENGLSVGSPGPRQRTHALD